MVYFKTVCMHLKMYFTKFNFYDIFKTKLFYFMSAENLAVNIIDLFHICEHVYILFKHVLFDAAFVTSSILCNFNLSFLVTFSFSHPTALLPPLPRHFRRRSHP